MNPNEVIYLDQMQHLAHQLGALASALDVVIDDQTRTEISMALSETVKKIADELSEGLDLVNRPRELQDSGA